MIFGGPEGIRSRWLFRFRIVFQKCFFKAVLPPKIVFEKHFLELSFSQQSCQWVTGFARGEPLVVLQSVPNGEVFYCVAVLSTLVGVLFSESPVILVLPTCAPACELKLRPWLHHSCQGIWTMYPEILLPFAMLKLLAP